MREDEIRATVVQRLGAKPAKLPKFVRPVRLITGLAGAGARTLGRGLARKIGRPARAIGSVGPEVAVAGTLGRLKGATMKMGQVLGYIDLGLGAHWRAALSALQTSAPPLPPAESAARVRAVLTEDFGAAGAALANTLEPRPLATASVGQVRRGRLADGTPVAVKIVHPNLARIIARDFAPAAAASRVATWIYPRGQLYGLVTDVRARLLEECDYGLEARRQQRFGDLFAGHATVVVPAVHPELSSPRVLTTTWADGLHLDEWLATQPSAEARNRAGEALFDVYVGALFRHGLYNCDPHPGNYLFLRDGRVAFVDFGCVREFAGGFVERLGALTAAAAADDEERVRRALVALGVVDEREPYFDESTRWLLRAFLGPMLRDEVAAFDLRAHFGLGELVRRWRRTRGLGWSGELVFLLRTFLGVSAVLARIGARANWYRRLRGIVDGAVTGDEAAAQAVGDAAVEAVGDAAPDAAGGDAMVPAEVATSNAAVVREASADWHTTAPEVAAAPAVPPVAAEAEAPAVPAVAVDGGRYDLVLVDAGSNLIALVRELREVTGLELRDVKYLIDAVPQPVRQAVRRPEADSVRERLEAAGARIEVRRVTAGPSGNPSED